MKSVIFKTIAPYLTALMLLFSVFILLRGHNDPGGGFIGGLVAASAFAIYGLSNGVATVRVAIYFHPMTIAGAGLVLATVSGLISVFADDPFMTSQWVFPVIFGSEVALSTPMLFDTGVYLVVTGAITSIALCLEEQDKL
ncbi:Na(+)/H(+) antiporter subunit B [Hartmannibacter diazotrophicus]|uniref:Na(+)/H(+) antiporter subunit B n=1 Tax=Hartmannibacter diazotrophicus TaxID=1482074 RepID=A0A2C9D3L2_9HYPH|nr:Na+/H+ antiporter subunit B [Hartmannibacter diazotrophicus]SON54854.1 Na(+)/H(+) antiporter subunit B [Hartmannibacter diazotrophicus]